MEIVRIGSEGSRMGQGPKCDWEQVRNSLEMTQKDWKEVRKGDTLLGSTSTSFTLMMMEVWEQRYKLID